jgi:hypothetical protein
MSKADITIYIVLRCNVVNNERLNQKSPDKGTTDINILFNVTEL